MLKHIFTSNHGNTQKYKTIHRLCCSGVSFIEDVLFYVSPPSVGVFGGLCLCSFLGITVNIFVTLSYLFA